MSKLYFKTSAIKLSYLILSFLFLFFPIGASAILDFVGEQMKDVATGVAYTDAVAGLLEEVVPDTDASKKAESLRTLSNSVQSELSQTYFLGRDTVEVLKGPNLSSSRVDQNIRNTTSYIRRLKSTVAKLAALGSQGITAIGTLETNHSLNEIQKNQQTLILQNEERNLIELKEKQENERSWNDFIAKQRAIRKRYVCSQGRE